MKLKPNVAITVLLFGAGLKAQPLAYAQLLSNLGPTQQAQLTADSRNRDTPTSADAGAVKPIFVPPGGNRSPEPTGSIKIKVSGADTGGAVAVLEVQTDPDFATPVHVHHVENEWFYAIEGEYEIKVGDEIFHLEPGGSVYAPKWIPHAINDVSEKGGRLMVVAQPAGHIEAFSVDLFKLTSSGSRDPAALDAIFRKHNMSVVGPPMPKRHPPTIVP